MILDTPVVLIDKQRLERNIETMAAHAREQGLKLRPHVKTHKIPEIAQLQIDAGAQGITCATIGEAEEFSYAGFTDIFISYPVFLSERAIARLNALPGPLAIGVDSVEMAKAAQGLNADIKALIELDSGHRRSGVLPTSDSLAEIHQILGERYAGVFTFPGHSYGPGNAEAAAADEVNALHTATRRLGGGFTSGGSSPSAKFAESIDEIRPGVYVFNDSQQLTSGACKEEDIAMTVLSTVVSRNVEDRRIILNAGSKILSTDKPNWVDGHGFVLGQTDARVSALSEHHATIFWPEGVALPEIGEQLRIVPNHACTVLNLVDEVVVEEADRAMSTWVVAARGKNS